MKKTVSMLALLICTALAVLGQQHNKPIDMVATRTVWNAIRSKLGTKEIKFERITYERVDNTVYQQKWYIRNKISGATGYGYAKVKYLGGNMYDENSWKVVDCYIDE